MAGRGATSSAVSLAHASCLIGDTSRELLHHPLPRAPSISEGLRLRAAAELLSESEDDDVDKESASRWIDALSEEDEDEERVDLDEEVFDLDGSEELDEDEEDGQEDGTGSVGSADSFEVSMGR